MIIRARSRKTKFITAYVLVVVILFLGRQLASNSHSPAGEPVENALIFISDADSIDAGRGSNSVYRIGLDGGGLKRIVGSIPHGNGYLRTTDIDCHARSQALVIASHRRDLNGFHHALLDGTGLHFDRPEDGVPLLATRQIAIAPGGTGILLSRQFEEFSEPRFGLVGGDLLIRHFNIVKPPSATLSYRSPVWSPSGKYIAYIIERQDGDRAKTYQIASARSSGANEYIYHETALRISDLAWAPTREWFALVMDRQVYRFHRYSGELIKLTDHLGGASSPRWSPDGAQISYVSPSTFPGQNQLFVMNADGSGKRRVANIRGEVVNGCWV